MAAAPRSISVGCLIQGKMAKYDFLSSGNQGEEGEPGLNDVPAVEMDWN
jgi:hypothetical protein